MSTKNIAISEDAYELLNDLREEDESYSDVIRRLAGRNDDIVRFSGAFPEIGAVADELEAERKETTDGFVRRSGEKRPDPYYEDLPIRLVQFYPCNETR